MRTICIVLALILAAVVFSIVCGFSMAKEPDLVESSDYLKLKTAAELVLVERSASVLSCDTEGIAFRVTISDIYDMSKEELIQIAALRGFAESLQWCDADSNECDNAARYLINILVPNRYKEK